MCTLLVDSPKFIIAVVVMSFGVITYFLQGQYFLFKHLKFFSFKARSTYLFLLWPDKANNSGLAVRE